MNVSFQIAWKWNYTRILYEYLNIFGKKLHHKHGPFQIMIFFLCNITFFFRVSGRCISIVLNWCDVWDRNKVLENKANIKGSLSICAVRTPEKPHLFVILIFFLLHLFGWDDVFSKGMFDIKCTHAFWLTLIPLHTSKHLAHISMLFEQTAGLHITVTSAQWYGWGS